MGRKVVSVRKENTKLENYEFPTTPLLSQGWLCPELSPRAGVHLCQAGGDDPVPVLEEGQDLSLALSAS